MEPRKLSISEAARLLEVTEARVTALLAGVETAGYGKWRARLYDFADVEQVGRRLRLGRYDREVKRVLVVGGLEQQAVALTASGLSVVRVGTVLEALGAHSERGMPILVVPTMTTEQEFNVLATVVERTYTVLIGREHEAPEQVRRRAVLMDFDELRKLVRHAWSVVETRIDQVNLRL